MAAFGSIGRYSPNARTLTRFGSTWFAVITLSTDIPRCADRCQFVGCSAFVSALRIGIFLSIFSVHINRSPCNAKVEKVTYKKGQFRDARDPQASQVNESNSLALVRIDSPNDRLVVRQISGAVAQRIVCRAAEGEQLAGGQKFGMIKFGSRTELYVPAGNNKKLLVKIGDKVKAGLTPLVKYEILNLKSSTGHLTVETGAANNEIPVTRHELCRD